MFRNNHIGICSAVTLQEAAIGKGGGGGAIPDKRGSFFSRKDIFMTSQIAWRTVPVVKFSVIWKFRTSSVFPALKVELFSPEEMCCFSTGSSVISSHANLQQQL